MTNLSFTITHGDGRARKVLGYRFAPEKLRDRKRYAATNKFAKLPPKVDLRPHMTYIENQEDTNSCVANAVAGAYEYLAKKHTDQEYDVSRMFIYYNARDLGGIEGDEGSVIADAIEGLREYGACAEDTWPFDPGHVNREPSEEAYDEASRFVVEDMQLVPVNLEAWKSCLAEGYPIVFGISLFESFDRQRKRGVVPMPTPKELARESHGGHAMLCVGYSDADKVFIVRNSWGEDWGDKGYCYIPYAYLMNEEFNDGDSWIIRQLENIDFGEEDWGDDSSIIGDFDTELANMSEDEYAEMLDAMGGQPLEFRLALIFVRAAGADEDLSDDELEEISGYLEEIVDALGVDTQADKLLRRAQARANDDDLLDESVQLLGEHLSQSMLASIVNSLTEIASVDDLDDSEDDFIATLVQAWQVEEGVDDESDEDEDEDDEDGEDEDEDDEDVLTLSGFYVYTDEAERLVGRIDKLCKAHTKESDHYAFEWSEEEDDDGVYVEFSQFEITPDDEEAFLAKLEALCEEACADGGYDWE
jgi:C1A family cysteine protease